MKTTIKRNATLDQPATYRISVPGHLDQNQPVWDEELAMAVEFMEGERPITTLTGTIDQAALHALLRRLYSLGLPLISVECVNEAG